MLKQNHELVTGRQTVLGGEVGEESEAAVKVLRTKTRGSRTQSASTFIEVMVGTAIMGSVFASLYFTMASGFSTVRLSRENLRATQIILNRMEGLRLYNWDQLSSVALLPTTFTETYNPMGGVSSSNGVTFNGTMTVADATLNPPATYGAAQMRQVTVTVQWMSAGVQRTRQMSTYVARHGVQNYVFGDVY